MRRNQNFSYNGESLIMAEYRLVKTEWGILAYAACGGKVLKIFLPPTAPQGPISDLEVKQQIESQIKAIHLFAESHNMSITDNASLLEPLAKKLQQYFCGEQLDFSAADCDLSKLSGFARDVLLATAAVSHGQVKSYREIAQDIGKPVAFRAVAGALAGNPFPIVIPCHRIICSDGKLGGYSGADGVEFKKRLLELEKAKICLMV
jgi:methylated-DNA-[protein]-cysteine S-methyltransferase